MNLLILHAGALGDCVLTVHLAAALRRSGHRITLASRSSISSWAVTHGLLDQSIPLDRFSSILWGNEVKGFADPQATRDFPSFDRVISFLGSLEEKSTLPLLELLGKERLIAIDPRPSAPTMNQGLHITEQWAGELRNSGLDLESEIPNSKSAISDFKSQISFLTRDPAPPSSQFNPSASHCLASGKPDYLITDTSNRRVIIHPGSGSRAKCCPLDALQLLMQKIITAGFDARWMIGPDEMERDGLHLRKRLKRTGPVIFEESVEKSADLVAASRAFVGNDAGMTHVAALTGVTTVALFGPTDPRIWRPLGCRVHVFSFPRPDTMAPWTGSILEHFD